MTYTPAVTDYFHLYQFILQEWVEKLDKIPNKYWFKGIRGLQSGGLINQESREQKIQGSSHFPNSSHACQVTYHSTGM